MIRTRAVVIGGSANREIRAWIHPFRVDHLRIGRSYRALRIRRSWRQQDLADEVGVSRQLIAKVESGQIDDVQVGTVLRIGEALGASAEINVRWRGEGLDRLFDAAHAGLVEMVVARLTRLGWESVVEASFSVAGERGSIDVFALHRATATVLVIEVKSVVPDSQAVIHGIDRKTRLARGLARERGWPCQVVGRLLVVGESTTARRRIEALAQTYQAAFPYAARRCRRGCGRLQAPCPGCSSCHLPPRVALGTGSPVASASASVVPDCCAIPGGVCTQNGRARRLVPPRVAYGSGSGGRRNRTWQPANSTPRWRPGWHGARRHATVNRTVDWPITTVRTSFDLPGGLGYAPPALDGSAVERASVPVAASLTREP